MRKRVDQAFTGKVEPAATRYVSYESLLATGRAVRFYNREQSEVQFWIQLQLAGEQGTELHEQQNRSFVIGFATKQSQRRSGDSILTQLRRMHREGRINTDARYNAIIKALAEQAKQQIGETNERVLTAAEKRAANAPSLLELLKRKPKGDE